MDEKIWYEFGGPGDHYSFRAISDKIALMTCILISPQGMMAFFEPEDMTVPSPMGITLSENPEKTLSDIFPDFDKFADENKSDILDALRDCMVGDIDDRKELEQNLEFVMPGKIELFINQYKDKKRSSLMNLHPFIDELIENLEKK